LELLTAKNTILFRQEQLQTSVPPNHIAYYYNKTYRSTRLGYLVGTVAVTAHP